MYYPNQLVEGGHGVLLPLVFAFHLPRKPLLVVVIGILSLLTGLSLGGTGIFREMREK